MQIILFLAILGCNEHAGNNYQALSNTQDSGISNHSISVSDSLNISKENILFLDSVRRKYDLSIDQIKKHTNLDSFYYTGYYTNVFFTGDTFLLLRDGLKGAVINYNDGKSCVYKFLFVFNSSDNGSISNKILYTDCDRDESSDYKYIRYKILSDSTFQTIETYLPPVSKKKVDSSKTTVNWKLNEKGVIDSLP